MRKIKSEELLAYMCRLMIRGGRNREEIKGVVIFSINTLIGFISSRPADHIALILMITGRGPSPGDKKKKKKKCVLSRREESGWSS